MNGTFRGPTASSRGNTTHYYSRRLAAARSAVRSLGSDTSRLTTTTLRALSGGSSATCATRPSGSSNSNSRPSSEPSPTSPTSAEGCE